MVEKRAKKPKSPAPPVTDPRADGRRRAVIDAVMPVLDGGRFPVKRIAGESVRVEAHCFTDGHDKLRVVLGWQALHGGTPYEAEMTAEVNDVWTANFTPPAPGRYRYTVTAWVDHFESWRRELERRDDEADIRIALTVGAGLIDAALERATGEDAAVLAPWAAQLRGTAADVTQEAFLEVWRHRERYRPERGAPRSWLLRIVRNRAIDAYRLTTRHGGPPQEDRWNAEQTSDDNVEDHAIARDEARALRDALARLPNEQLTVMDLAYFGGLTQTEIANELGIPLGTVKGRVRLALNQLQGSVPQLA